HPEMTIADAYAIQRAWVAIKHTAGRKLIGHKIGLTSRAMQRTSNITEPDYGALDRKSTRLNSSHVKISYAVFCLKKKNINKKKEKVIAIVKLLYFGVKSVERNEDDI